MKFMYIIIYCLILNKYIKMISIYINLKSFNIFIVFIIVWIISSTEEGMVVIA